MSTPLASASAPASQTKLSLTNVEVTFLAKRPETKMKLTIKVGGDKREVVINKGKPVQWTGMIRSPADAKIALHTHRRNRAGIWVKFASVGTALTEISSPVVDVKQQISVVLTVYEASNDDPQISDVLAQVNTAKATVKNKTVLAAKLGKLWRVLEIIDAIGEPLKDMHPAVGTAMAAVGSFIRLCKLQKAGCDGASDLVDQLMSFLSIGSYVEKLKKRSETRRAVQVMLVLISETSNYICEKTRTGLGGIIGDLIGSEYKEEIEKLQKQFARAKESFDRSVQLEIFAAIDEITLDTQFLRLHEKLNECDEAHFRAGDGCLEGTRSGLRERVVKWMDDTDVQPNLFWLFGNAGSGKSTVANTVAKLVDPDRGFQLSCFFCKRDDPNLSNPRKVLPTLAYRFAQQHESYRAIVLDLLRDGVRGAGITTTADIDTQFDKLFVQPLRKTLEPARPHVIVIDALDECGSEDEQATLAKCILALSRMAPWIKVFVTSRNEIAIRHVLLSPSTDCISCDINDEQGVNKDIQLYIESRAKELKIELSDGDIRKLVKRAEGLFIWCRTLFEHLRKFLAAARSAVLAKLLSGEKQHEAPEQWSQLYELYDNILESALGSQADTVLFMRAILSIVNVAALNRPLSVKAIMSFLGDHTELSVEAAEEVVEKLHAVLYVDANGVLRAFHASFYDFLMWKADPKTRSGWKTLGATHRLMALSCLRSLREELKFNICKIETPVLNKDISDLAARISKHIPEVLQYSTRFWHTHLPPSTLDAAEIERDVLALLRSVKLLFLFECLSLQGCLRPVEYACLTCFRLFFKEYPDIISAAEDAHKFVTSFADAMDSVPHIYLSALLWLPEESLLYRNLVLSGRKNWHLISNKQKSWDVHVWHAYHDGVYSVAFSPDGCFVAYGTEGGDVYIRDSHTGAPEGDPLQGHEQAVYGLAYSPDGRFIASGSEDRTVRIWDVRTGKAVFAPLRGHSNWVRCVAFSPDGLFVASGSSDCTIRIWNARTGEAEGEPLQHLNVVYGLAYSPDGRLIASACFDHCVHVWDVSSREEAVKSFRGHQNWVLAVTYSPDGRTIVSGSSDKTIRVWNAHTGEAIGDPLQGHTNFIRFVAYSPDGRFIISDSSDGTMRLWEAASHTPVGEPLRVSAGAVESVTYSPDGSLIVSTSSDGVRVWDPSTCFAAGHQAHDITAADGAQAVHAVAYSPGGIFIASGSGDDRVRLWNTETGAPVDQPVLRHAGMDNEGRIKSVAYSRDGRFVVSGSADGGNSTVCVLDAQTGTIVSGPLKGHSSSILSVAYSPDGHSVASASWDKTVRLWDVQTSTAIGEPLQTGSKAVSVAFSPDGHLFACGTSYGHIWVWDARTRTSIRDPIHAHSRHINSVAFSPDGHYIASASDDRSVKIWDAHTGEASGGPPRGHQGMVRCVAYSPDGRFIASGSHKGEIIIWDAQSGTACSRLRGPSGWVNSVAYSPDGRFLASGASNGKIYVLDVSNEHDEAEARWIAYCSGMDMQDGWVKGDNTLLLWVPAPYREDIRTCARFIINNRGPNDSAFSIDYRTLLTQYSGSNWTDIFLGFDD